MIRRMSPFAFQRMLRRPLWLTVVFLLLAGIVWLYQAVPRADVLQYIVGLTLLCLSGASVGLVDGFPLTVTGKVQKYLMREEMKRELGLADEQTA